MFSGFKKLFIVVLVLGAAGYFAAQWKVDKDIKKGFENMRPFARVTYEKSSLDFAGNISVKGVNIKPNMLEATLYVEEMSWSLGNLYQTVANDYNIRAGQLPARMQFKVKNFNLPFEEIAEQLPAVSARKSSGLISAAACGSLERIGFREFIDMGYSDVVMSFEFNIEDKDNLGVLVVEGSVDVENTSKIKYKLDFDKKLLYRLGASANSTEPLKSLELSTEDSGYNQILNNYCGRLSGVSGEEYINNHTDAVVEMLNDVEIIPAPQLVEAYKNLKKPGSTFVMTMSPQDNLLFSDLDFYDSQTIQRLLGLEVFVNGKEVKAFFEGWQAGKFNRIADKQYTYTVKPKTVQTNSEEQVTEPVKVVSYKSTPIVDAEQYIGFEVLLVRNTKDYRGILVKVLDNKFWVKVSQSGGEAVIPVGLDSIDDFQVLK